MSSSLENAGPKRSLIATSGQCGRIIRSLRSLTPSGPSSLRDDVVSGGCAACGSNL
jgi:hypothetical protein